MPEQTSPAARPLLLDGTVSFALYGTLLTPNDHRGFRARFRAGDTLTLRLLVPDIEPERSLAPEQRPVLIVTEPGGQSRIVHFSAVSRFTESFSGTKFLQYVSLAEPAVAGDYGFIVDGQTPATVPAVEVVVTSMPALHDVVDETVPPVGSKGSPTTAVLLGAGAVVVIGLGVGVSRRRRR
jgi:hypothetical protein